MLQTMSMAMALMVLALFGAPSQEQRGAPGASVGRCDPKAMPAKLDFTLDDVNGRPVKLVDFRGKLIVLNFWATWCIPCRAEIPALVELQSKYARQGLQIVGVSIDDPADKMKPFVGQYKINYPVLTAFKNEAILDTYGPMVVVPATVVIERDGKLCGKHVGPITKEAFEKDIKGLL